MTSMQQAGMGSPRPTVAAPPLTSTSTTPKIPQALLDLQLEQKKRQWASWVEKEYSRISSKRQAFERQWHINLAFYSGRQHVAPVNVAGVGFRLVAPKAPPWRVRMVINKIRVAVRTEASKLTSARPVPIVIPATTEDEDYSAARVAEQILKSEFSTARFDHTMRSFVWWGVVTGNSFLKSYYDPNGVDEGAQKPAAPVGNQQPGMQQEPQLPEPAVGKICIERVNPFHIYVPDLLEEDLELQPFIIHVTTKSPLWVKKNFGITPTPDSRASNTIMESAVLNANTTNEGFDSIIIKEVWLKPNAHPDFPEGGILTVCGDRVVQHRDTWPLPFSEYPFYKYDGMPTGGFYTDSVVTDLIGIQKEYNRTKSQMIEIKNLMGKPKLLAPRGSIDPRKVSSEPGQAILYTPGYEKPQVIPGVEVPNSMHMELDRLAADFDDISGQHEITRGNTPAQVTSGTAISFLQEQDDSKLAYQIASIEACVQKLGTHYLKYASNYWTEERLVRIVGSDGDFEARHWKGSDLRGNTDVRVQSGSALPFSKAARQALVSELMVNQFISPESGLEMMELGGLDKLMEDLLTDKRAAQRENMRQSDAPIDLMHKLLDPPVGPPDPLTGQPGQPLVGEDGITPLDPNTGGPWQPQPPIPVNTWDNHEAHVHFHNQFRKTQQFELLDEILKQAFELHVQTHQIALQSVQMGAAGPISQPVPPDESTEAQGAEQPPMPQ